MVHFLRIDILKNKFRKIHIYRCLQKDECPHIASMLQVTNGCKEFIASEEFVLTIQGVKKTGTVFEIRLHPQKYLKKNHHAAAPPQFRDKEYTDDIQVTTGTALTLTCYVDGSPQPTIKWLRDGRVINEATATLSDDDQKLIVQHSSNANHR